MARTATTNEYPPYAPSVPLNAGLGASLLPPHASLETQETNVADGLHLFACPLPREKTIIFEPVARMTRVAGRKLRDVWDTITHGWIETPIEPATAVESNWWHGDHLERRQKVRASMERTCQSAMRRESFEHCGSGCRVEWSATAGKHRLRANFCHDRFCERCARARARVISTNLAQHLGNKSFVHCVLTLKHRATPLSAEITRLIRCFRNLRDSKLWKEHVQGGVFFIEIKTGRDRLWHVHAHIVCISTYIPQQALANAWLSVTGDSDIVWLHRYKDSAEVTRYVAKYAAKGYDAGIFDDPESIDECITAMKGRRLWATFGAWRGLDLDAKAEDPGDWKSIGTLDYVVERANAGEIWAHAVLKSLRKGSTDEQSTNPRPPPK